MKNLKNFFGLVCLFVLALTSVALTSCSSDDDSKGGNLAVSYKGETYYTMPDTPGSWDRDRVSIMISPKDDWSSTNYFNVMFDEDLTSSGTLTNVEGEFSDGGFGNNYDKLTSGSVEAKVDGGNITLIFHNAEFANGVKANGSIAIDKAYAN